MAKDRIIEALFNHLPSTDLEWSDDGRAKWLRALAAAIVLAYDRGGKEDGEALLVRAAGTKYSACVPVGRAGAPYGDETIRVVVLHETAGELSAYVAQGLERDIAAQGSTAEQALRRLAALAEFDNKTRVELGLEVPAAPPSVFALYERAPKIELSRQ